MVKTLTNGAKFETLPEDVRINAMRKKGLERLAVIDAYFGTALADDGFTNEGSRNAVLLLLRTGKAVAYVPCLGYLGDKVIQDELGPDRWRQVALTLSKQHVGNNDSFMTR